MDVVFKTKVINEGGRSGSVRSTDGNLGLDVAPPRELGGKTPGTNPEQLFAAAYAADFGNALGHIVRTDRMPLKVGRVEAELTMYRTFEGTFRYGITFTAHLSGETTAADAELLMQRALTVCPLTDATKTNLQPNLVPVISA